VARPLFFYLKKKKIGIEKKETNIRFLSLTR